MRQITRIKIYICILALPLFILWYNVYREFTIYNVTYIFKKRKSFKTAAYSKQKLPDIKYALIWTNPSYKAFVDFEIGQSLFIRKRCPYVNCYMTADRYYLEDYTQFDAILFAGPDLIGDDTYTSELPARRSENQKYVFLSIESSEKYPLCSKRYENYFNWTWTFRLDSESRLGYIAIRTKKNKAIIGPKKVMHWLKLNKMLPVSKKFKRDLSTKTKAAAWFVSRCRTKTKREEFVSKLKLELQVYGLTVDIFGRCGDLVCPIEDQEVCDAIIKKNYYFYLAFEDSFDPDYVTEKLLYGLRNHAIPVVYGGANYTRFMPEGIYLDARKLGPKNLARKMNELIKNPNKYAEYFKWTNHYTYHKRNESADTDDYCNMCKLLNNKKMVTTKSVYKNFKDWWNLPNTCRSKSS